MKTILIIGASRGLGLEFVRQYRADGWLTLGTCRSPEQDALLAAVGATSLRLDVNDEGGFAALARTLEGRRIDVCIYNAGVFGPRSNGLAVPTEEEFDHVMRANVLGAMRALPVVVPALARAKGTFAAVSSIMGSIAGLSNAHGMTYRASKAALNAVVKGASVEARPQGVTCISLHPGWVKTDMGGSGADIEPSVSIRGMRKVIADATLEKTGKFFDYTGHPLDW